MDDPNGGERMVADVGSAGKYGQEFVSETDLVGFVEFETQAGHRLKCRVGRMNGAKRGRREVPVNSPAAKPQVWDEKRLDMKRVNDVHKEGHLVEIAALSHKGGSEREEV